MEKQTLSPMYSITYKHYLKGGKSPPFFVAFFVQQWGLSSTDTHTQRQKPKGEQC